MVLIIVVVIIVVLLGILVKINFADTDVSIPVRIILSGLILLIFAAGVYYLVTPDAFQSKAPEVVTDTIAKVDTAKKVFEVVAPVKNPVQPQKKVIDTAIKKVVIAAPTPAKVDTPVTAKVESAKSETSTDNQEIVAVQNTGDTSQFDNYKVKLKAYLYNRPDVSSRRTDFLFFFNSIPLSALDERNGFIQVSFKTNRGKRYEGWLRKSDLVSVDE